jgi:hypothetical protein
MGTQETKSLPLVVPHGRAAYRVCSASGRNVLGEDISAGSRESQDGFEGIKEDISKRDGAVKRSRDDKDIS